MILESKYVLLLSSRLVNFKRKSSNKFEFRCPYCGDSKKSKNKTRGTIFERKGRLVYNCFNCGASPPIGEFIKFMDNYLYSEYLKEKFENRKRFDEPEIEKETVVYGSEIFDGLPTVQSLDEFHEAKKLLRKRKIPERFWGELHYAERFKEYTNSIIPHKFAEPIQMEEDRIVIPYIYNNRVVAFQGRAMKAQTDQRYITVSLTEDPKIYGHDKADMKKQFFVFEGPFDSMFMPNSVAVGSSNLKSIPVRNSVLVFDNQPRNPEIVKRIDRAIQAGYSVVIWPKDMLWKDVNESVEAGYDCASTINKNIYNGLEAKLKFIEWRK